MDEKSQTKEITAEIDVNSIEFEESALRGSHGLEIIAKIDSGVPKNVAYREAYPDSKNFITSGSRAVRNLTEEKCKKLIMKMARKKVKRLERLADQNENLNVALGATNSILDRAGLKPIEKVEERRVNLDFKDLATLERFLEAVS